MQDSNFAFKKLIYLKVRSADFDLLHERRHHGGLRKIRVPRCLMRSEKGHELNYTEK